MNVLLYTISYTTPYTIKRMVALFTLSHIQLIYNLIYYLIYDKEDGCVVIYNPIYDKEDGCVVIYDLIYYPIYDKKDGCAIYTISYTTHIQRGSLFALLSLSQMRLL